MAARKKKRKAIKYKTVEFKLSVQQKKRVDAFCKDYKTTPITMYKTAIQTFLSKKGYGIMPKHHEDKVDVNQMSIFDLVDEP